MLQAHTRFFFATSLVLVVVVLAGFSRTFYLRAFFDVPSIPAHIYVHALLVTSWFGWLCLQSGLVMAGRTALHRKLGLIGAGIGFAVIIMNVVTVLAAGPRLRAVLAADRIPADFLMRAIWGDVLSTISFTIFLVTAIAWRHRADIHKRLMLLASFSIIGPAVGRIAHLPVFAGFRELGIILSVGTLVLTLGALMCFDLKTEHRIHPVTAIGSALRVAFWFGASVISSSDFGQRLFRILVA